ncbi:aldehyde dehydrogenase [Candidatus Woesearchaeota archaeon]|nr:aldehyde dehydrogenase [Candidatus Woesearchaeota archaeon]
MTLKSYNPFTDELIGEVSKTTITQLDQCLDKGKVAQAEWSKFSLEERASRLKPLASLVNARLSDIIETLVREAGMPINEARSSTTKLIDRIKFLVEKSPEYLQSEDIDLKDGRINRVLYQPIGTVAVIMPWNHPFMIPFWTIIPALIAGNNVLFKPSELVPFVGKRIEDLFEELDLPEGLVSTAYGDGKLGRYLSASPYIDMVSFAGSVAVGKKIYREAAENMKRLILENGGKDALIVGNYTDKEKAADQILVGFLRHAGQLCSSVRRVYIVEREYEEYLKILKDKIKDYKVGNPADKDTVVGPLKSDRQKRTLDLQIEDALTKGGVIAYRGQEGAGRLYPPTIIGNANPKMDLVRQETFGPVIPIIPVRDLREAVAYLNESMFGLNASIWHDNVEEAIGLASQVQSGTVTVNMLPGTHNYCTWHGVKMSGIGNILSPEGVRQFTNRKNIRYYSH